MEIFLAFVIVGIFLLILMRNKKLKRNQKQKISPKKGKKVSFYYLNFPDHDEDLTEEEEDLEEAKRYKTITLHQVDENYIYGYCHTAKAERTYVREKIEYFTNGQEIVDAMYEAYLDEYATHNDNFISIRYSNKKGEQKNLNLIITSEYPMFFNGYVLEDGYDKYILTFSYENVLNVLRGERFKEKLQHWQPIVKQIKSLTHDIKRTGINIIGFSESESLELEGLAKAYRLKVLKTQTKTLFAIVTNGALPETQIERATENGTLIMNKEQFITLLYTGDISYVSKAQP